MRFRLVKKNLFTLILSCVLTSTYFSYLFLKFSNSIKWEISVLNEKSNLGSEVKPFFKEIDTKLVLFWTGLYLNKPSLSKWGISDFNGEIPNCSKRCKFSIDKNLLNESDAVIFHTAENLKRYPRPIWRSPNQIYIMFWYESPSNTLLDLKNYKNFFNWTVTYRNDSDFIYPYGKFEKLKIFKNLDFDQIIRKKSKQIAWIVSNCETPSDRETFVKKLSKYIKIDIFGDCSQNSEQKLGNKCPGWGENCYDVIGPQYKFYLSLENSICPDYITEKFFSALSAHMVPITYGHSKSYKNLAPNGSYIDSSDFENPENLAKFLKNLDEDDLLYSKYLEWKNQYEIKVPSKSDILCQICEGLYENRHFGQNYENIDWWWRKKDKCHDKKSVLFSWANLRRLWNSV